MRKAASLVEINSIANKCTRSGRKNASEKKVLTFYFPCGYTFCCAAHGRGYWRADGKQSEDTAGDGP